MRLWSTGATEESSLRRQDEAPGVLPTPGVCGQPWAMHAGGHCSTHLHGRACAGEWAPGLPGGQCCGAAGRPSRVPRMRFSLGLCWCWCPRNDWLHYQEGKLCFLPCVKLLCKCESVCYREQGLPSLVPVAGSCRDRRPLGRAVQVLFFYPGLYCNFLL